MFEGFRWFPAVVGGFLGGLVIYFLVSFLAASPQIWSLLVGWLAVGYFAGTGKRHAWGRVWLVMSIAFFALPIASLLFSANVTSEVMTTAGSAEEQVGAAIGGAIGTTMLAGLGAFIGFFMGIIFAILAYFGLRSPKEG